MLVNKKWAHPPTSKNPKPHLLQDHLFEVANIGSELAKSFGGEGLAYITGIFHDIGKATENFQKRLKDLPHQHPARHPRIGAVLLLKLHATIGQDWNYNLVQLAAYLVDHHHGGFYDLEDTFFEVTGDHNFSKRIKTSLKKMQQEYHHSQQHTDICGKWLEEAEAFFHQINHPKLQEFLKGELPIKDGRNLAFFLRMTQSCLIEADRRDTALFCDGKKNWPVGTADWPELKDSLDNHYNSILANATASELNKIRSDIAEEVVSKSNLPTGIYVLNIPTGGGKTLTASKFSVLHGALKTKKRIIYGAPFCSIIDQNAEVLRNCFGEDNVLEHHSNFNWDLINDPKKERKYKQAWRDWNYPVIATTTVQLLESLFSSRCSRLRKLHNIQNSIIILDEFQSIPMELMKPTYQRLEELVKYYNCTVILASATSPIEQVQNHQLLSQKVTHLVSDLSKYEHVFDRVEYIQLPKTDNWKTILDHAGQHDQTMIITNKKWGCEQLRRLLPDPNAEHIFHLSTSMEPRHRKEKLNEVRNRIETGRKVLLICTPTVEAGVDIDFPVVYKQRSPFDSIIQAGGRCNREGKLDRGTVYLFSVEPYKDEEWLGFPSRDGNDMWYVKWEESYNALRRIPEERLDYYYRRIFCQGNNDIFDDPKTESFKGEKLENSETFCALWSSNKMYQIIHQLSETVVIEGRGIPVRNILQKEFLTQRDHQNLQRVSISTYQNRLESCTQKNYVEEISNVNLWVGPYHPVWGTLPYEFEDR